VFQNSILSNRPLEKPGKGPLTLPIVKGTELILLFKFKIEVPNKAPFTYTFVVPSFIKTTDTYVQSFKAVFGKTVKELVPFPLILKELSVVFEDTKKLEFGAFKLSYRLIKFPPVILLDQKETEKLELVEGPLLLEFGIST
jgi:hypothetical protein